MGRLEISGAGIASEENIIITAHGDSWLCKSLCALILTTLQELYCSHSLFFVEEEAEAERFCNLTIHYHIEEVPGFSPITVSLLAPNQKNLRPHKIWGVWLLNTA